MTDTELSVLEAAAKAATPGPWHNRKGYKIYDEGNAHVASAWEEYSLKDGIRDITGSEAKANAAYIAVANPAIVLELIEDLRHVKVERDWLVQTIEDEQYCYPAPRMEGGRLICEEQDMWCDKCDRYSKEHWLKAAKEATSCQK